ncbi:S8 family peptidase [Allorhizocola rhizosphaerae]|uniref:S8 family peptidase n=1 Tax=Allorhizocola rhizosphaerae TaxID=1872709 RepID=UPI001FEC4D7B|nr:S8 family peptidase [Allorhizocola rhizosphaerae]
MKLNRLAGRRPAAMAVSIVATATLVASAAGGAQAAPTGQADTALYLVQTTSEPLATNEATKPAPGQKVNTETQTARQWLSKLTGEHDATLRATRVNTNKKVYDYGVVFNGFAARLTPAEAARMKSAPGVVRVWKDEIRQADTTTTRDMLGLSGNRGVWQKQFRGSAHAGEGMIVGVVDSGIWPENPAFAALAEPRPDAAAIAGKWKGSCDTGEASDPGAVIACNNKVIGARYFKNGIGSIGDYEFLSPRDFNGHGSHTASTAAGNFGVNATINGFAVGSTSGVAPAARIAVYKALWEQPDGTGSGTTADLVAAINQAVKDGVDVINYSISGSRTHVVSADEIAFLNAANAGVFVATSAGNSGDTVGVSSVAHNSPWTTTVAASTHDRGNAKTVTLGNGAGYTGVGVIPPAVASSPLVNSTAVGKAGANATEVRLCYLGTLDPALVAGKIVVCDRGGNARTDKSKAVKEAGGVGMIQANTSDAQSINGDWHYVPTVHVGPAAGTAIKAYAATAGATAALSATDPDPVTAPVMAGFSSYGPAQAGGGDLLKPDITAPGVDVIAAVAPPGNDGKDFDAYSGTSMSSPHIAGIATLIKAKHPDWSPMAIKSAMMTTASTKDSEGRNIQWAFGDATPLNYGAGHVVPGSAFDPGLVYDSGMGDWLKYACGIGQLQLVGADCGAIGSIDPSDLNYASIAVGDLAGSQTVTRTVKNVSKRVGVYVPVVQAPAGFTVKVSTPVVVVLPGKTATFKVTITRKDAALGQWAFGTLKLKEIGTGRHVVSSPIAVRPVGVAAAGEVALSGASGSSAQQVKSGFAGTMSAKVAGLAASAVSELAFAGVDTGFDQSAPAESAGVKKITVEVPAGTTLARFATYDADVPADTDVDLFAYQAGTADLAGASAGGSSEEAVTLTEAGTYDIYVVLFAAPGGSGTVKHHAYAVPDISVGNLTVNPASQAATIGGQATFTLQWTGLTAGARYLGVVSYSDGTTTHGRTIISIAG